jgi:hypothetical protein
MLNALNMQNRFIHGKNENYSSARMNKQSFKGTAKLAIPENFVISSVSKTDVKPLRNLFNYFESLKIELLSKTDKNHLILGVIDETGSKLNLISDKSEFLKRTEIFLPKVDLDSENVKKACDSIVAKINTRMDMAKQLVKMSKTANKSENFKINTISFIKKIGELEDNNIHPISYAIEFLEQNITKLSQLNNHKFSIKFDIIQVKESDKILIPVIKITSHKYANLTPEESKTIALTNVDGVRELRKFFIDKSFEIKDRQILDDLIKENKI